MSTGSGNLNKCAASVAILAVALIALPMQGIAQGKFPSRPISIIAPYGPGSGADISVRAVAAKLQPRLGQNVLVENRTGANGMIAAAYVAKSKPDGHTFFYGSNASMAAAPAFFKSVPYDPIRDFASIAIVSETVFLMLAQPEHKGVSFPAYLEKMRANPDGFSIGGVSTLYELLDKAIKNASGVKHVYVRYTDQGKQTADLLGGRLTGVYSSLQAAIPLIRAGQAHAIAVASPDRLKALPGVPAMAETFPGLTIGAWSGFFAPAKTPKAVVDLLSQSILAINREPDVVKRIEDGGRALYMGPEEADRFSETELVRWAKLVQSLGIEKE